MDMDALAAAAAEFNARERDPASSVHMSFSSFGQTSLKDLTRQMSREASHHRSAMFATAFDNHPSKRAGKGGSGAGERVETKTSVGGANMKAQGSKKPTKKTRKAKAKAKAKKVRASTVA